MDTEVAVIGAGVVGCATALALTRRGASVTVLEAEAEPGLAASGTNSGILHTGFDSPPGELETELILRAAELRDPLLEALGVPVIRCGALMRPLDERQRDAVSALAATAERNGIEASLGDDGSLSVPGEAVTDPVAFTLGLAGAARRHGAELRTPFEVASVRRDGEALLVSDEAGEGLRCRLAVNCAGLGAGEIALSAGDESFDVYPRKGEFLVFEPPGGEDLHTILLPVPEPGTKGVLVFPTVDGKVVAGPTAHDQEDRDDWMVRPEAVDEIRPKAAALMPALHEAEPISSYAGLRPAGRDGANYVIGASRACDGLVNVAAIRSTGLTASLGIAERVVEIANELGLRMGEEGPLERGAPLIGREPWWRRTAEYRRSS